MAPIKTQIYLLFHLKAYNKKKTLLNKKKLKVIIKKKAIITKIKKTMLKNHPLIHIAVKIKIQINLKKSLKFLRILLTKIAREIIWMKITKNIVIFITINTLFRKPDKIYKPANLLKIMILAWILAKINSQEIIPRKMLIQKTLFL